MPNICVSSIGTNPCKNNNGGCVHLPLLSKQKCFCKEEFTHHSSEMNKKRKTGGNKILQGNLCSPTYQGLVVQSPIKLILG